MTEKQPTWARRQWERWTAFSERYDAGIRAFCLAGVLLAMVGVFTLTIVRNHDAGQREADQAATAARNSDLLECIGTWADDFTGTLTPIREASVARDLAVTDYRAAQNVTRRIDDRITVLFIGALQADPATQPTPAEQEKSRATALEIFAAKDEAAHVERDAYRTLRLAERALRQARKDNPYPDAPKFACGDQAVTAEPAEKSSE